MDIKTVTAPNGNTIHFIRLPVDEPPSPPLSPRCPLSELPEGCIVPAIHALNTDAAQRPAYKRLALLTALANSGMAHPAECHAALVAAHHDFTEHWPGEWPWPGWHAGLLKSAAQDAKLIAESSDPSLISMTLDDEPRRPQEGADSKIEVCVRMLLEQMAKCRLLELAQEAAGV